MSAPTGRVASVAVSVHTIAALVTWNCAARMSTRKTTTKKSEASSVQPRKPAVTACHCCFLVGGEEGTGIGGSVTCGPMFFLDPEEHSDEGPLPDPCLPGATGVPRFARNQTALLRVVHPQQARRAHRVLGARNVVERL